MTKTQKQWVFAASWLTVAVTLWLVAVPSAISVTTFGWLNAVAVVLGVVFVTTLRSAAPTSSIAQVLYDTEHQSGSGR